MKTVKVFLCRSFAVTVFDCYIRVFCYQENVHSVSGECLVRIFIENDCCIRVH